MKSLETFVQSYLDFESSEDEFIVELCETLSLDVANIKRVDIKNYPNATKIVQMVIISLRGENRFKSEDIAKIKGLTIVTPNKLEIEVGEIHL